MKIFDTLFFNRCTCFEMPWTRFAIFFFKKVSVCIHVYKILWALYLKTYCTEINETLYPIALLYNLVLIRFWCIFLKKFRSCLKLYNPLMQWYRTKLHEIVPNRNSFKIIILKFNIFIYNSKRKIIYNFCMYGEKLPFGGEIYYT